MVRDTRKKFLVKFFFIVVGYLKQSNETPTSI